MVVVDKKNQVFVMLSFLLKGIKVKHFWFKSLGINRECKSRIDYQFSKFSSKEQSISENTPFSKVRIQRNFFMET